MFDTIKDIDEITGNPHDLPPTSSVQKQITYGRHIAEQIGEAEKKNVYNAFIMPYSGANGELTRFVGIGTADWETYDSSTCNYKYVLGILLDTKWLISKLVKHNDCEIEKLADLIEKSLSRFRIMVNQ